MTNKKSTKKALLLSALSLLLCCSMLVGTTFAWFTDEVQSGTNKIYAGNLDVEVVYDDNGTEKDVQDTDKLFDGILWEPGAVAFENITVKNVGTLALKYAMYINFENQNYVVDADGKLTPYGLASALKVAIVDGEITETDRDKLVASVDADKWTSLAALVEQGNLYPVGHEDAAKGYASAETYGIIIYWQPGENDNNWNVHNGKTTTDKQPLHIDLGIKLVATQKDAESDSFGPDYDEYAGLPWDGETVTPPVADANGVIHITNAAELVAMMDVTGNSIYSGKTIVLDADIDLNGNTVKGIGRGSNFAGTFDGQGHTISNFTVDASDRSYYAGLFNQVSHGGTVKNLTVKNATVIGKSMVGAIASSVDSNAVIDNCKAIDCTLIGVKKVGAVVGYTAGSTVTNNYAENCTVYYSEKEGGAVLGYENTGSTVSNNTYKNVTVKQATVILTAEDLLALGGKSLEGTYEIMADIDLKDAAMPTIGAAYGKTLTINGNGHTISNATTAHTNHNGMKHHGFFYAYTDSTLSISNLTFKNIVIDATKDTERNYGAGIIVAFADGGSTVNLTNVDVKNSKVLNNTPDIGDEAGVYVGYQTGTLNMVDCDSTGCAVAGETAQKTGAFIGMVNGNATLTNCTTDLTIGACNRISGTLEINGLTVNSVSGAQDLNDALAQPGYVILPNSMTFSASSTTANSGYGATGITVTSGSVLDGNGNTLTVNDANGTWDCAIDADAGTIKNLTVSGAFRGIFMGGASGDVYIDNVIIDNVCYPFNSDAGSKEYGVYISNSTLNGWTSFSDVHKEVVFTNCNFGKSTGAYQYAFCRPYNVTSFVNCDFAEGYTMEPLAAVTFENCTIGGVALTAANLDTLVTSNITNATVK